jgi:hypothetical protein
MEPQRRKDAKNKAKRRFRKNAIGKGNAETPLNVDRHSCSFFAPSRLCG